ncbi:UMP kinase [Candidatus Woesearchaeota archaeon]|nr:UMP kinase [Candidatus Woesearchaeota archaeon]
MHIHILSVGGSLIVPDEIDYFFLKEFKNLILKYVSKGHRFIILCGGGKLNSKYNQAACRVSNIEKEDLDWIGIKATQLNAELMRAVFGGIAYEKVITNPTEKIRTKKHIILGGGWKPGWSTDYDAVLVSKQYSSREIINLTNIDYVYDRDPRTNKDAKKFESLTWVQYRKLITDKWSPRLSTPFDPIAAKEAEKSKQKVVILNGKNIRNLENYFEGKHFEGTIIQ